VLTEGQTVEVKITDINNDKQKVSLSIRALLTQDALPETEETAASDNASVVVYDTDAPPAPEEEAQEEPAPETEAAPEETAE
jgi:4-hydroxy-3-methylbut-2-enyl diphosphate reductase